MKRFIFGYFAMLILATAPAVAEEDGAAAAAQAEAEANTFSVLGEIHEIDYATRTAIISGYEYRFVGLNGFDRPSVKLYGSQAGSLELLQKDMRVRVRYLRGPELRIVVSLQEVDAKDPENALNE